jgi:putative DNA methylase
VRKKLIEVALPLEAINVASAREKSIRQGHPSTLHLWWARRPLAAARAVLFAQLVDDPSAWPELFPTEDLQNKERQRLFRLIEDLVQWENSNKQPVINATRLEIARSHARGSSSQKAKRILFKEVTSETVNEYLATELPPIHDPFAGGGTIPLEAQRLGLRAIASDLNPVAVMINKALIEIPPKFAGNSPVNPESRANGKLKAWKGSDGLAEDVRYYGAWMREEAKRRIGHLYPEADLPKEHGGGKATIIAWLWARTVPSPDPAFGNAPVPLVSSFWLSTKPHKMTWLEPIVDRARRCWRFDVATGHPDADQRIRITLGTKTGRGDFVCLLSGSPMPSDYIRAVGQAGNLRARLIAIVAHGSRGRIYLPATEDAERLATVSLPESAPMTELPAQALGFRVQNYGLRHHRDLFSARQLVLLTTLSSLVAEAREKVLHDADQNTERANAVATYLALAVTRLANYASTICSWHSGAKYETITSTFGRQALSMTWDFAEGNPFSESSGNFSKQCEGIASNLDALPTPVAPGVAVQADAIGDGLTQGSCISTDPPYYDNISYANLSDFFYVWLRASLGRVMPDLFPTVLTPKEREIVSEPGRFGGDRVAANKHFEDGIGQFFAALADRTGHHALSTIFYAFKQQESSSAPGDGQRTTSSGWEKMLSGLIQGGLTVAGTWPIRTEQPGGLREFNRNSLASSIVLVCRERPEDAPTTTRGEFRRMLRKELPDALKKLQQGNIAPVDVAQASIGPGMAIFSRHKQVVEADGGSMSVRGALQLINEVLDEYLSSGEGDFDADTRFAITWFEQRGWEPGPYGEAETLAKARNISVQGVVEAGICISGSGKVRLLKREELPAEYDLAADERPTVWEFTQHMIRYLEERGEEAAARHMKQLGSRADTTRELAYRLYNTCERKKWAEDARSYNGLILAWPELEKLAARMTEESAVDSPIKGGKKGEKPKASTRGQQDLFEGGRK